MPPRVPRYWCAYRQRAGTRSTSWFAKQWLPAEQHTRSRRTTALCTVMHFRTWTDTSGSLHTWIRARQGKKGRRKVVGLRAVSIPPEAGAGAVIFNLLGMLDVIVAVAADT